MLKKTVLLSFFIIASFLFISCSKEETASEIPPEVTELQAALEQFQSFTEIAKNFSDIQQQMQNIQETEIE